jgi:hypothetical protein
LLPARLGSSMPPPLASLLSAIVPPSFAVNLQAT